MKRLIFLILFFCVLPGWSYSQDVTYADFNSEDNRDMNFEILGKINGNYLIYKNIRWKHLLAVYGKDMQIKETVKLGFVPEKTFNVDFIPYSGHFYMIYQYQKNKIVYCMAVKMDGTGKVITEPFQLDTTRIAILADNKIYNTVFSQDKQKILIYKRQKKNQQLSTVTKLFDADLNLLDSTRTVSGFDDRREVYGDMFVDNEGKLIFTKETKNSSRENMENLEIFCRRPGVKDYRIINVELKGKYVDETKIRIDNLNKSYLINTLYFDQRRGNITGLYSTIVDAYTLDTVRSAFNAFPDSIRSRINTDGYFKGAFDNLFLRETILKKDGGYILTAEDFSTQSRSNPNNPWNRTNYLYNNPGMTATDYYLANSSYGYYRPFNSFNNWQNTRYYYENILIMSMDSSLTLQWNSIIPKSQADDDNDNYLSYTLMNAGSEIHFLFNEGERNRQIISNQSISPEGKLNRYPTLKSREIGFEFMPRHARQVGYGELIVPCVYRTNITFARVVFND